MGEKFQGRFSSLPRFSIVDIDFSFPLACSLNFSLSLTDLNSKRQTQIPSKFHLAHDSSDQNLSKYILAWFENPILSYLK